MIHLSTFWLIVVNTCAWLIVHFGVAYFSSRIGVAKFNPHNTLFKTRSWELNGRIYQNVFRVRRWKRLLPSGGKMFGLFSINDFHSSAQDYIGKWIVESCRAELTHWIAILPVLFFILWNPVEAWIINIVYAFCANLPCIISQRYNRPRVLVLVKRKCRSG